MLIDGQIRNRLVSLADTVEEAAIDDAFLAVVQGAAARRKRDIATRSAVAATALCIAAAGVAFGWSSPTSVDVVEPVPADRVVPDEPEPKLEIQPDERRRSKKGRKTRSSAGAETRASDRSKSTQGRDGRTAESGAVPGTTSTGAGVAEPSHESQDVPVPTDEGSEESSLRFEETHREAAPYGPSLVSANPDRRSGCSLDGQSCGTFIVEPGDSFASVSVADDAGAVFVRLTQWDRHGRRLGEPLTFCGGEGPPFALAEDARHISVSIEKGVCGGAQTAPAGGQIETSFFKQVR